jgi:hypothetical protein
MAIHWPNCEQNQFSEKSLQLNTIELIYLWEFEKIDQRDGNIGLLNDNLGNNVASRQNNATSYIIGQEVDIESISRFAKKFWYNENCHNTKVHCIKSF